MTPHFAGFIALHFDKFVPQLERLIIRSENNFEVLVEFLESCGGELKGIGIHSLALLRKYKPLYLVKPDLSLRFVGALTRALNE
jgi:hypothetical protein